MTYLENIKNLIEKDIIFQRKSRLHEENHKVYTYFEIGKLIVEAQGGDSHAKYGNNLINEWSKELTLKYGKGYDASNLRRMRQFYLVFRNCATVWHNLSWSHLKIILSIKSESERNYYINLCLKQYLSVRKLEEKIKNKEYERLEFKDNIKIINNQKELTIKDMIKNPILIPINKSSNKISEKALKQFILDKIEEFLLELGVGFTYVGSEIKLGKNRCDLLFFNIELTCYIVIELKIRKLKSQDIGQIGYYMSYIDENMKKDYMNKTIGVILCKEGDEIVIKYITNEKLYVSTFKLEKEINQ